MNGSHIKVTKLRNIGTGNPEEVERILLKADIREVYPHHEQYRIINLREGPSLTVKEPLEYFEERLCHKTNES